MDERQIMDESGISRSLSRIAHEILERNRGVADVLLVGIHTRGVFLARRLAANLAAFEGAEVPVASLDINLYRDDLQERAQPRVRPTEMPFSIAGKRVVLVDDVLFTGRTVRAASGRVERLRPPAASAIGDPAGPRPPGTAHSGRLRGPEHPDRLGRPRKGPLDGMR